MASRDESLEESSPEGAPEQPSVTISYNQACSSAQHSCPRCIIRRRPSTVLNHDDRVPELMSDDPSNLSRVPFLIQTVSQVVPDISSQEPTRECTGITFDVPTEIDQVSGNDTSRPTPLPSFGNTFRHIPSSHRPRSAPDPDFLFSSHINIQSRPIVPLGLFPDRPLSEGPMTDVSIESTSNESPMDHQDNPVLSIDSLHDIDETPTVTRSDFANMHNTSVDISSFQLSPNVLDLSTESFLSAQSDIDRDDIIPLCSFPQTGTSPTQSHNISISSETSRQSDEIPMSSTPNSATIASIEMEPHSHIYSDSTQSTGSNANDSNTESSFYFTAPSSLENNITLDQHSTDMGHQTGPHSAPPSEDQVVPPSSVDEEATNSLESVEQLAEAAFRQSIAASRRRPETSYRNVIVDAFMFRDPRDPQTVIIQRFLERLFGTVYIAGLVHSLLLINTPNTLPRAYIQTRAPQHRAEANQGDCCICLDAMSKDQWLRTLRCGHTLHRNCIDVWLQTSTRCPLCRGELDA